MPPSLSNQVLEEVRSLRQQKRRIIRRNVLWLAGCVGAIALLLPFCSTSREASTTATTNQVAASPKPKPSVAAKPKPSLPVQPLPANGKTQKFWQASSGNTLAPLRIETKGRNHHFVKVVNSTTEKPVLTVFVQAGKTVDTKVPLGTYKIRYAAGAKWYGQKHLFGDQTFFGEADKQFQFKVKGNQISGFRLSLYQRPGGNLRTKSIAPTNF